MMTKYEAEQMFREQILPFIRQLEKEHGGGPDYIMRREEWNNFTDSLCKDRLITDEQYEEWTHPDLEEIRAAVELAQIKKVMTA